MDEFDELEEVETEEYDDNAEIDPFDGFDNDGDNEDSSDADDIKYILVASNLTAGSSATITDSRINKSMEVAEYYVSDTSAVGSTWTITTGSGSLTISGTISSACYCALMLRGSANADYLPTAEGRELTESEQTALTEMYNQERLEQMQSGASTTLNRYMLTKKAFEVTDDFKGYLPEYYLNTGALSQQVEAVAYAYSLGGPMTRYVSSVAPDVQYSRDDYMARVTGVKNASGGRSITVYMVTFETRIPTSGGNPTRPQDDNTDTPDWSGVEYESTPQIEWGE